MFRRLACRALAATACLTVPCLPARAVQVLPLAGVHAGQDGYALTAAGGNVITRFPVRVLDVYRSPEQAFPFILVRASGEFIEQSGGVAAGMSGSPVYVGDRLAGAISGGFPEADHSLALVTPIEAMLTALPSSAAGRTARLVPDVAAALGARGAGVGAVTVPGYGRAVPLSAPLVLNGLPGRAGERLAATLAARGLRAVIAPVQAAAGAGGPEPRPFKLEPGAAISVQLVTGDDVVGAVGTVTYLDGQNLLAFGHPLLGDALGRYAAAPAYVNAIVPSSVTPFKLAESVAAPFGAILTDRAAGVGGRVGADAGLVPFELSLRGSGVTARTVRVRVAPVESLLAPLVAATGLSALDRALGGSAPGSALVTWTFSFTDRDPIVVRDFVADASDLAAFTAGRLAAPVELLARNPFQAPALKSIAATVDVGALRLARLVKLEPESRDVRAGETIALNVRLQPWRADAVVRRVTARVPADARPGPLTLTVRGGLTPRDEDADRRDPFEGILTFDDLLERLKNRLSGEHVLVEAPQSGVAGAALVGLDTLPYPVSGLITVELNVKEKP